MSLVKTVLTVLVILVLLYYLISWLTSKSVKLTDLEEGTVEQKIDASELPNNNTSNFTYSIWFFVNDWNYQYGQKKVLLKTHNEGITPIKVTMGATENDLDIVVKCYGDNSEASVAAANALAASKDAELGAAAGCPPECSACQAGCTEGGVELDEAYGCTTYCSATAGCRAESGPGEENKDWWDCSICDPENKEGGETNGDGEGIGINYKCGLKNFPLQKWVNLIVSVYGRTLDVYIDGKLVKTCVAPGPIIGGSGGDISVTPGGGFDGWTSALKYWADSSNPQQAYNIYKSGYGGSIASNLMNKYRLRVAFLEDGQETGAFEI
jgi:hypothetical protein